MEIVVEIVEPGRRAPSVKRFHQSEILVGRAWDADLVIADEEVDARHLRIRFPKEVDSEKDAFEIEDLDSANGLRINGRRIDQSREVHFGDTLTVGQTMFRVHRRTDSVGPTTIHSRLEKTLQKLGNPLVALVIAAFAIFIMQYSSFMSSGTQFQWENQLSSLISMTVALSLWAIIWGGIAKLLKHQMRIWAHLGLASVILIASVFLDEINSFLSFNLLSPVINELLEATIFSLMIFVWVSLGFIITANVGQKTRTVVASILVVLFLVTSFLIPRFQNEERVYLVPLETASLPPGLLFSSPESVESFVDRVGSNIDRTEESAVIAREENEEEN